MNSKIRIVLLIAVAVVIVAAIIYGYSPKPVGVDTALVDRGVVRVTVTEEGVTRVIDRFLVSAPVAGYARRIELHVGDAVKKGQTLVTIEPLPSTALDPRSRAEAEARRAAAAAALRSAEERARALEADARVALLEAERVKELFSGGFVSTEDFERAEAASQGRAAQLRSAEFSVKVAKYELEAAKSALGFIGTKSKGNNYGKVVLRSPVAGRVLKVLHESEGVVANAQPLIEIGDPKAIEIATDLLSADSVKIAAGTKVLFERWGGEAPLKGRVRVVEPAGFTKVSALGVEEQRVLIISDITTKADLWKRLGDGFRVESSFIVWEGEGLLRVPVSALFRDSGTEGSDWAVFLFEDGRAVKQAVEIGHRTGLVAEVTSGLTEGSEVITHPDEKIEDGAKVKKR
jgi:HlyD family secretion protein